jgi:methyltransferase (TIGR00027 family)
VIIHSSEEHVTEIKNVSGTAFVVAEFRAEENYEVEPLYRDWIVDLFLNEQTKLAARRVAASFPPTRDMVRVRTRYFDDMLDKHIKSHFNQVVILGAGLDTRPVRKPAAGVAYFEIDDAETLSLKKRSYEEAGLEPNVTFIPGNYVTDGLINLLRGSGFSFSLPTFLIWEGNTMYLTLDSTKHILSELKRNLRRFRLSFDYMAESVVSGTTGDQGIINLVQSFADMGAPWLSGIRDVQNLAHELSLDLIENFRTAELFQRYWRGRAITSPIFDYYSVCTVGI